MLQGQWFALKVVWSCKPCLGVNADKPACYRFAPLQVMDQETRHSSAASCMATSSPGHAAPAQIPWCDLQGQGKLQFCGSVLGADSRRPPSSPIHCPTCGADQTGTMHHLSVVLLMPQNIIGPPSAHARQYAAQQPLQSPDGGTGSSELSRTSHPALAESVRK